MIQFLQDYWFVVVSLVLALAELLILILKKNKVSVVDTAFQGVLEKLPLVINFAEYLFGSGNGEKKKEWCLNFLIDFYKSLGGKDQDEYVKVLICDALEQVLSTPQKKD